MDSAGETYELEQQSLRATHTGEEHFQYGKMHIIQNYIQSSRNNT